MITEIRAVVTALCLAVLRAVALGQGHEGEATAVVRSSEDQNHDRSYQGLYGDVRSVITERKQIEIVSGKPKWGKRERSVTSTFDSEGRELERLVYAVRGFPTKTVNRYDASGRLMVTETYASNSQLMGTQTYEYASDGRLREITVSNGIRLRFEYDSAGRLSREYGADSATSEGPRFAAIPQVTQFRYDSKGRLLERANFNADGAKAVSLADVHRINFSYDNPVGCRSISWEKTDGTITLINQTECFAPDKPKNPVERFVYEPDGKLKGRFRIEYTFDHTGNWTRSVEKRLDGATWLPFAYEYRRIEYFSDDNHPGASISPRAKQ
jgi:YD repeat-containing protein